jgi:MFS family permease
MTAISTPTTLKSSARLGIWLIGVSFVLFQFFLQLSSGVVIGSIMHDMHLSALTAGILSSALYIVYTSLQIPVGILFDKKNTRTLMAVNALLCSIGCFVFAASYSLFGLFVGRLLIGTGSAFAFIGLSHLLRQHYPLRQFAFMIGLSETLGFAATVVGMIAMGTLIATWGWRGFINTAGTVGVLIAFLSWKYIPNSHPQIQPARHYGKQLLQILTNGKAWINGFFVGLTFTVVTAYGALWAVPFIQVKLSCNLQQASMINAVFFLGTALSCPLFGILATHLSKRRPLILSSCLSTSTLLLVLLYMPIESHLLMGFLMFLMGICCGAYMLAYTIANELAPAGSLSTCTGFTNMLAMVTTPLLQPLIGYLLDVFNNTGIYTLANYQIALLTIPISLIIACILVFFLPEKP